RRTKSPPLVGVVKVDGGIDATNTWAAAGSDHRKRSDGRAVIVALPSGLPPYTTLPRSAIRGGSRTSGSVVNIDSFWSTITPPRFAPAGGVTDRWYEAARPSPSSRF